MIRTPFTVMSGGDVGGTCNQCGQEWRHVRLVDGRCPNCRSGVSAQRTPAARYTSALQRRREEDAQASAEFRAASEGERLGSLYGGDPFRAAAALGASVYARPLAEMQDPNRPDWTRDGFMNLLTREIVIASDFDCRGNRMTATAQERVLAHELAHLAGVDDDPELWRQERLCDVFAASFLASRPETPLEMAVRIQREGLERERRRLVSERAWR
jgi:hypothetical protein